MALSSLSRRFFSQLNFLNRNFQNLDEIVADSANDAPPVETRTAPVQSVVTMECRTDLRQPVKYTWSRQGGILPKSARVEGVMKFS